MARFERVAGIINQVVFQKVAHILVAVIKIGDHKTSLMRRTSGDAGFIKPVKTDRHASRLGDAGDFDKAGDAACFVQSQNDQFSRAFSAEIISLIWG